MATTRVPPNFFGFSFGLAGLSETWAIAAGDSRAPHLVGPVLAALSAAAWLVVLIGYLRYAAAEHSAVKRDLLDPIAGPFLSLALISPMICAVVGLERRDHAAATVIVDVFLVLTVLLGGSFTGQWIYGPLDVDKLHPGYFLPTVAGGLVASDAAALVGQHTLAEVTFGLGVVSWLVMGSLILGRLFFRPQLPTPLLPTLTIEVAPAAVASLAWFDAHGDRIDTVAAFLAGYGVLMMLAQLRLLPLYLPLPFMPSTWAFTFSWAAVASAALHWLNDDQPTGYKAWEYVVVAAISVLITAIAARTLLALQRRQLFPSAAPPPPNAALGKADAPDPSERNADVRRSNGR
jgi:tellurite resistance protein